MTTKPVPFAISRGSKRNLVEQTVEGFRRAIRTGYYRAGDYLPSFATIASSLGVSMRIPIEAIGRLAEENLVSPRQRRGCLVLPKSDIRWKGVVLVVLPAECQSAYYASTLVAEIRRLLALEGYMTDTVAIAQKGGGGDLSQLREKLQGGVAMVFTVYATKATVRTLEKSGVPYVDISDAGKTNAVHPVCVSRWIVERAVSDLVDDCHSRRVRRVLLLNNDQADFLVRPLVASGIRVETLDLPGRMAFGYLERMRYDALQAVMSRFSGRKDRLPDLVLAADDVLAEGALTAFSDLGLRAPDDFGFVTFANAGNVPVYPRRLTCLLNDPRANAEEFVRVIVGHLSSDDVGDGAQLQLSYVRGDTFG